jgi:putative ABC transport system substrate-binding protein
MRRRELVTGIGTLPLWQYAARAQLKETYRLGVLVNTRDTGSSTAVVTALRDRGYVEGQNLIVEWRLSGGDATRWLPLARDLGALKVDAIMVETTPVSTPDELSSEVPR